VRKRGGGKEKTNTTTTGKREKKVDETTMGQRGQNLSFSDLVGWKELSWFRHRGKRPKKRRVEPG